MQPIDRAALSRALAKALAYHETGQAQLADEHARDVVKQLRAAGVLADQTRKTLTTR